MKTNHFYISVSNGLLQNDHQKRMGTAIWQFLWCLDKVTRIDNDVGLVLGGKPIQLKDITGTHRITVSKNLKKLEIQKYIELTHTPYGIVIRVMKMKKRFNKPTPEKPKKPMFKNAKPLKKRISENAKPTLAKTLTPLSENAKPMFKNVKPNKTMSVDNTMDNINMTVSAKAQTPKEQAILFFDGVQKLISGEQVEWLQEMLSAMAKKNIRVTKQALWQQIKEFCDYWTERNSTGKKERWEMQKTFEVDRRLSTWFRRAGFNEFSAGGFSKTKGKAIIGLED